MKKRVSLLANLLLSSTLFWGVPLATARNWTWAKSLGFRLAKRAIVT